MQRCVSSSCGDIILLSFFNVSNTLISREHFMTKDLKRSKVGPEDTCLEVMEGNAMLSLPTYYTFNALLLGAITFPKSSQFLQGRTWVVLPAAPGISGHADGGRQFQSPSATQQILHSRILLPAWPLYLGLSARVGVRDSTSIAASGIEMDRKSAVP